MWRTEILMQNDMSNDPLSDRLSTSISNFKRFPLEQYSAVFDSFHTCSVVFTNRRCSMPINRVDLLTDVYLQKCFKPAQ